MQGAFEGMPEALGEMITELRQGWSACEVQLLEALNERDAARRERSGMAAELHATELRSMRENREVRVRAACDLAALRGEVTSLDQELLLLSVWRTRADNLSDELSHLKLSHSSLMQEHNGLKIESQREKMELTQQHKDLTAKLTKELDETRERYETTRTLTPNPNPEPRTLTPIS